LLAKAQENSYHIALQTDPYSSSSSLIEWFINMYHCNVKQSHQKNYLNGIIDHPNFVIFVTGKVGAKLFVLLILSLLFSLFPLATSHKRKA
jgi:hypothetical protein